MAYRSSGIGQLVSDRRLTISLAPIPIFRNFQTSLSRPIFLIFGNKLSDHHQPTPRFTLSSISPVPDASLTVDLTPQFITRAPRHRGIQPIFFHPTSPSTTQTPRSHTHCQRVISPRWTSQVSRPMCKDIRESYGGGIATDGIGYATVFTGDRETGGEE